MADRSGTLGLLALSLAGVIAVPVAFGSLYTSWRRAVEASLPDEALEPAPAPPVAVEAPEPPEDPTRPLWPREVDGDVFGHLEGTLTVGTEAHDVVPQAPYRIDLSRPAERALVHAAKVDLDRDGSWDERWTFADRAVVRESSPADDGRYTERYRWQGGGWARIEPPVGG
jgi:hypothetical protein